MDVSGENEPVAGEVYGQSQEEARHTLWDEKKTWVQIVALKSNSWVTFAK